MEKHICIEHVFLYVYIWVFLDSCHCCCSCCQWRQCWPWRKQLFFPPNPTDLIISELEECSHGVTTRGQHKQQRCTAVTVSKSFGQVKWRRLDELLANLLCNKLLDCRHDLKTSSFPFTIWIIHHDVTCDDNKPIHMTTYYYLHWMASLPI